ncbi:hypothetical protein IID24_03215 [Patescibacteria group bacterium]|nr:hypothetical protein [Patescibacteria group bacterium]
MKKYRVKCEPEWDYIYIEVEAENEERAKEKAEEAFSNGDWEPDSDYYSDPSAMDYVTAVEVEEIK